MQRCSTSSQHPGWNKLKLLLEVFHMSLAALSSFPSSAESSSCQLHAIPSLPPPQPHHERLYM